MAPDPLAVWAKEHNVEYDDSKLAWALFGHIAEREAWFAHAIESWKQEEQDWMDEKKKIAEALQVTAKVHRDAATGLAPYLPESSKAIERVADEIEKKALSLVDGL